METRHVEVARFSKRAAEYKLAADQAPDARCLELAAVVAIVSGTTKHKGWSKERVQVVDLMAGNGALTRALRAAGFRHVVPIEACSEMHPPDASALGYVNGGAFANLRATMAQLRPQVIVSLASFHHLIEYAGRVPDSAASVAYQCEVIEDCVAALADHGVFVLADICECENLAALGLHPIDAWSTEGMTLPPQLSNEERLALTSSSSLAIFCGAVESIFGHVEKACPVQWFRQVVHRLSDVGHDDAAVCSSLLRQLKLRYGENLRAGLFPCPWLFDNIDKAKQYVLHKFGFLVDRKTPLDETAITKGMMEYLKVSPSENVRVAIQWGLAAITIEKELKSREFHAVAVVNIVLVVALVLLAIRIAGRLAYVSDAIDDSLGNVFWLTLGVGAAVCGDSLKRHFVH